MLEIKNLNFSYNTKLSTNASSKTYANHYNQQGLFDINFSFSENNLICLLGSNGSYKSTLLNLLIGVLSWQEGLYVLHGENMLDEKHNSIKKSVRQKIGFLLQSFSSDEKISVFDNLYYASKIYGLEKKHALEKIEETLHLANLTNESKKITKHLSLGMRKRLELYRSFIHKPKLVLLDEPTESLDPFESRKFFDFLQTYKKENNAIVIMTTQRSYEAEHADMVVMLQKGRIIAKESPANLLSSLNFLNFCFKANVTSEIYKLLPQKNILQKETSDGVLNTVKLNKNELDIFLSQKISWDTHVKEFSIKKPDLYDAYENICGAL